MVRRLLVLVLVLVMAATACGNDGDGELVVDDDDAPDAATDDNAPDGDDGGEGGNAPSGVDSGYLTKVARDTLDTGTGRFEMTMDFGMAAGDDGSFDTSMVATGEWDTAAAATHVSADMGPMFDSLSDSFGEDLGAGMGEMFGTDFTMESIQIGSVNYLRMPMLASMAGLLGGGTDITGDTWISTDVAELGGASDLTGTNTATMDPSMYLELLEGAGGEVEALGPVEVRGVGTEGFRVQISVGDALESAADEEARAQLESALAGSGAAELAELEFPMEIYVDDDGLVRRVAMSYDFTDLMAGADGETGGLPGAGMPDSMAMSVTMDFYDFGADDIVIEAPPAEDVVPMDELGLLGLTN